MYSITLIPGDSMWIGPNGIHDCDEKGIVKKCKCLKTIEIENKEDYIRVSQLLSEEREHKKLLYTESSSNIWLLQTQSEIPYLKGSFIEPSPFDDFYQMKINRTICSNICGVLTETIDFNNIPNIPKKTIRTQTKIIKENKVHSYSNEILTEEIQWNEEKQKHILKKIITYEILTSNIYNSLDLYDEDDNFIETRLIPEVITKEIIEPVYDNNNNIIYDIDYNNLIPKYKSKYISYMGLEITKQEYLLNINNSYHILYVPCMFISCSNII
jgi:hypothetical protein